MTYNKRKYWVMSPGGSGRDFSKVFLDFGIMLIGPGGDGKYSENKEKYEKNRNYSKRDLSYLHRFAEEMQHGDIIIMRSREKVYIGVVGDYFYNDVFNDVDNFSQQHGRYVTWYEPQQQDYSIYLPPRLSRLQRLNQAKEAKIEESIEKNNVMIEKNRRHTTKKIPEEAKSVDAEKLIKDLIDEGLSSGQAESVVAAFRRVRRLGGWYNDHWKEREDAKEDISEHETRTFLIVPFLLALGWPEQRLKIEWRYKKEKEEKKKVDIAFFRENYSYKGEKPFMILESKGLDKPLFEAEGQAKEYAKSITDCRKFITSDGIRYVLYEEENDEWTTKAYLNLLDPLDRHPYDTEIGGASELLKQLLPNFH
jgi:type I site-specific restriction endonuclease